MKTLKKTGIIFLATAIVIVVLNHIIEIKFHNLVSPFHIQPALSQNLQREEKRLALVIGNSNYEFAGNLANPTNDADDMSKTLRELGFEVILLKNANLPQMEETIERFADRLKREKGTDLLFFAGHGIQYQNENYLVPVEAKLKRNQDLRYESVPLGKILGALEDAQNKINIVILDACRNNHFTRSWRSIQRGLVTVEAGQGTYIAYAAAPGEYAYDGQGRNGIFTTYLLNHIKTPNLDIDLMFRRVRKDVINAKKSSIYPDSQIPWSSNSILGEYSLNPTPNNPPPPRETPPVIVNPTPNNPPPPANSQLNIPQNLFSSATRIDYTPLRNALAAKDFRKADGLTAQLILKAGDKDNSNWLEREEIKKLACVDLSIIDQLWIEYSDNHFGYSIQRDIYRKSGGMIGEWDYERDIKTYRRYAITVGWKKGTENHLSNYLPYNLYIFNTTAPKGHLPAWDTWEAWAGYLDLLFLRTLECNI